MEVGLIPELDLARLRRWVDSRSEQRAARTKGLVRYELDLTDRTVTLVECRPAVEAGVWP
jgi:hypothetical protein